jgi:ATP-binding cassette subfamily G (WHITE) protein 2
MQILGIEKLADSFIGDQFQRGLSGGEKRRVSIATELLMSPGIMFLDEPTTGLDSTNAAKVVDILSGLGAMGTTVLLSIHQPRPDIFRLLDRVLVLSGDGSVVYSGPSALASAHFNSMSFVSLPSADLHIADYMLDVVLKSPRSDVKRMVQAFTESEVAESALLIADTLTIRYEDSDEPPLIVPKYVSPYVKQVCLLWQRLARVTFRHPFLLMLHFASTAGMSIALGLIFWNSGRDTGGIQNRMGVLFFIILYLTLMSLSSLPIWKEDQILFRRERASGVYGTNAYFTAVVLFDVVILRVTPPLLFAFITYWMVGLHANLTSALCCALILIMTNVAASALCMCVGIVSPSNASANVIGLLALLISILCGGFLLNKQDPHSGGSVAVTWLEDLSFVNYAFEALLINEFLDAGTFYFTPKLIDSKPTDTPPQEGPIKVPVDGKEVLKFFSFGSTHEVFSHDITVLFTIMSCYLALAFVLLKVSQRDAMY